MLGVGVLVDVLEFDDQTVAFSTGQAVARVVILGVIGVVGELCFLDDAGLFVENGAGLVVGGHRFGASDRFRPAFIGLVKEALQVVSNVGKTRALGQRIGHDALHIRL